MWGCSHTVIIINSKLRLVSAHWKPSGKVNSSEIPPETWTLSESRSCLFLKQVLASKCTLNALWCGNSHDIPARYQTLSESEFACYILIGILGMYYLLKIKTDSFNSG